MICRASGALYLIPRPPSAYLPQHAKIGRAGDPGRAGLTSRRASGAGYFLVLHTRGLRTRARGARLRRLGCGNMKMVSPDI